MLRSSTAVSVGDDRRGSRPVQLECSEVGPVAGIDRTFTTALDRVFVVSRAVSMVEWTVPIGTVRPGEVVAAPVVAGPPPESLPRIVLTRSTDLVRIEFRFVNLRRVNDDGRALLVRKDASHAAYLIAVFGPQHLLEQAFLEAAGPITPPAGQPPKVDPKDAAAVTAAAPNHGESPRSHYPVQARIAEPSRLSFHVTGQRIEFSERGLLHAMRVLPLKVVRHAEAPPELLDWRQVAERAGTSAVLASLARLSGGLTAAGASTATDAAALIDLRMLERATSVVAARFGPASAVAAVGRDLSRRVDPARHLRARVRVTMEPTAPTAVDTALEIPWRLQLSPHSRGAFAHRLDAESHDGRVELWHSRLGTRTDATADLDPDSAPRIDERTDATRTVRAVWTRDIRAQKDVALGALPDDDLGDPTPFRASLSARDRVQLVHLTSNSAIHGYHPAAAAVESLMLSSAGGWLALQAGFAPPPALSIEEWKHRATGGRDHYVKVVYQGVLLPFGHRASLVKVTERKVKSDGFATLYQRFYVVVREHERRFTAAAGLPFGWVRILTNETPALAVPKKLPVKPAPYAPKPGDVTPTGQLFVPKVPSTTDTNDVPLDDDSAGVPFRFRFAATDATGRLVEFDGPLVFAEKTMLESTVPALTTAVLNAANEQSEIRFPLLGQRIAYAPPVDPDDTRLATDDLRFDAVGVRGAMSNRLRGPNYVEPNLRVARAVVPAMAAFTGQADPIPLAYPAVVKADPRFTGTGNPRGLFLQVVDAAGTAAVGDVMGFERQTQASGGFLSPSVAVAGLARVTGPVGGDLSAFAKPGGFDVGGMFPSDAAKLFGVLSLADLLGSDGALPKFATRALDLVADLRRRLAEAMTLVSRLAAAPKAVRDRAQALATGAEALLAGFADALKAPAAPAPDFRALIATVAAAATALETELASARDSIPIARPTFDAAVATVHWFAQVADGVDGAAERLDRVVGLVKSFLAGTLLPERVSAELTWETALKAWPAGGDWLFKPIGGGPNAAPGVDARLRLVSRIEAPLTTSGTPEASVSCSLPPFTVHLFPGTPGFVDITVKVMEFSVQAGRKPDVNVRLGHPTDKDVHGIAFVGALGFVERLRSLIPDDGFSDPPYLDIEPSGLKAGYDQQIPDLAVGVFALTNIHLGAELTVPFIGEAMEFRFYFATRDDPFRLQVAFFAGGGFFAVSITPNGLKMIEAALEFGAAASMSFGVASGSISVVAGIYFKLEVLSTGGQQVQLTGYFRARGMVDVLHLITASIELYLELRYESTPGGKDKATGTASISVEVSVTFVSFSVTVSCTKQFAGSKGDPTFLDTMGDYHAHGVTQHPWADYCAAFAKEA